MRSSIRRVIYTDFDSALTGYFNSVAQLDAMQKLVTHRFIIDENTYTAEYEIKQC